MIPKEEKGLIVSDDIMGVMRYKNFVKKDEAIFLYKIDISNVKGVSLKDNLMINHAGLQKFLKHTPQAKYETLDSIGRVSNGAVYLSETHIYL